MKCPYQLIVIHQPECKVGYNRSFAKDITEFGECIKSECPFYKNEETERCRRAESEKT